LAIGLSTRSSRVGVPQEGKEVVEGEHVVQAALPNG
jgi:hypothetical protein